MSSRSGKDRIPAFTEYSSIVVDPGAPKLSSTAERLVDLLYFFNPECIPESLLVAPNIATDNQAYNFLVDRRALDDAIAELTKRSVMQKDDNSNIILSLSNPLTGIHEEQVGAAFTHTVQLFENLLPDFWASKSKRLDRDSLRRCEAVLPHIMRTMEVSRRVRIKSPKSMTWIEIALRAGWYYLESQQPDLALFVTTYILHEPKQKKFGKKIPNTILARTHKLVGRAHLDLSQPRSALDAYKKALGMYETQFGPESFDVAEMWDSLAYAHTEVGNTDEALKCLRRADAIYVDAIFEDLQREDADEWTGDMPRIQSIRALIHLRAGEADDALSALQDFWKAQQTTQADIEASPHSNHSGDILLLARIYWAQGKSVEAQELVSRTITMRRNFYGENGGPRVADSLFFVALILDDRGHSELAITVLQRVVHIAKGDSRVLKPHVARACWFLANIEERIGEESGKVAALRIKAQQIRRSIMPMEWPAEDTDEGFMRLVSWMLW